MLRTVWVAVALVASAVAPAFAEDTSSSTPPTPESSGDGRVMVVSPLDKFTAHGDISPIIYVNRCVGGCPVQNNGINDAREDLSEIPRSCPLVDLEHPEMCGPPGDNGCTGYPNCTLSEFATVDGKLGSNGVCVGGTAAGADCTDANSASVCTGGGDCHSADDDWKMIVDCMKEVYSPFNIQIVETRPANTSYTMAIIAGHADEINWQGALGVAPVAFDCSAQNNVISFSFANDHTQTDTLKRTWNMCWTAAQETAHAFGLDHAFQFSDGTSACSDPMTYRVDCGGEKFFRNKNASCGTYSARACRCGGQQNSHQKILGVFGAGTPTYDPPTITVTSPAAGSVTDGQLVTAQAGSRRGVETVELWLNGYKWAEMPGAKFGLNGQPDPSTYSIAFPSDVPDGVIDIEVRALDDLGATTAAPTIRVTKGAPCTDASSCAEGQRCDGEGRCLWDAPVGALGDACDYPQYCTSGLCIETSDGGLCSQDCIVGGTDVCPSGYTCEANGTMGACLPDSGGGGCCSVGKKQTSREIWLQLAFGALVLGLVVRRRSRRR